MNVPGRKRRGWRGWRSSTAVLVALVVGATACSASSATTVDVVAGDFALHGKGDAAAIAPVAPLPLPPFQAGQAVAAGIEAFAAADPAPGTVPTFVAANPTHEGFPLIVSVIEASADGQWLNVRFPQRPNGTSGWIRAGDVELWPIENRIEVSLPERMLRVYAGTTDEVLFEALVSVGADTTPTPVGSFFIDIVNPLGAHPTYGWGQLSVSGFSDVLETFAGGIGQIAIHGWNRPADMGRNVSNGCVRMNNDEIERVAELAPLGTPVEVLG